MPAGYSLPALVLLLAAGLLTCVAGYRLFRFVLGVYGFILGAFVATTLASGHPPVAVLAAGLVGGILGALILTVAYFAGVALVGGAGGVLFAHAVWSGGGGSAPTLVVIIGAIVGAVLALVFQRYVIIVATAFGGAWTAIAASLALSGNYTALRAGNAVSVEAWLWYPSSSPHGLGWPTVAWLVLGIIGTFVQLRAPARQVRRPRGARG